MSEIYKNAGVNVEAGYKAVELMKKHVQNTHIPGVMSTLGGFGGAFELGPYIKSSSSMSNPVLVSGTDGVGTKLVLAFDMDIHNTVGIDLVAMCVNDIAAMGAKPLFFLDYIATGKVIPEKIEQIVAGISTGCVEAGAALIGGETAEMPAMYNENEYDLAGFTVGIVDKEKIIIGEKIKNGNVIIGLASSGVHSNGFSLVRKIIKDKNLDLHQTYPPFEDNLGKTLLAPTRIYAKQVQKVLESVDILGISHITGGGFIENIPRSLPHGLAASINLGSWDMLPIFDFLAEQANIHKKEMYGVFNMGIGMTLVVAKEDSEKAVSALTQIGEKAFIIGEVVTGSGVILNG